MHEGTPRKKEADWPPPHFSEERNQEFASEDPGRLTTRRRGERPQSFPTFVEVEITFVELQIGVSVMKVDWKPLVFGDVAFQITVA
ncbi:hypothetical protein SAMN05444581_12150 [Methylocapsa palsarum]|uniref:Uncharacterized protein n=1 Tax=Methylocapsa palsarum TaxID=1612308 RepID=A0A1I4CEJ6_9HYPH|nr:hypothetical protein SAMN05444581_12150 [Methylocapsa palsarum]